MRRIHINAGIMFKQLGTPSDQKEQKVYNSDHYVPRNELIKETLAWLDKYLGPGKREEKQTMINQTVSYFRFLEKAREAGSSPRLRDKT